ncbi:16S rRNA (guanine(527)-N(7))-methyltransferase RsmG [Helicobacter saguini]|nr:16S rRNA (guanine(527)-N(7))-methyltransferase RsmG [Helicobacter saguini]MWV62419.1 16S rRNA (guanine(527)-N(7))-methyltransferase RsmG [Helicobacter saguini]MWV66909.1 16S rRNA (guanine(527)-N(7))-methyltransferase RsmG [Helicobacter saguini]MWV69258.1 16S rRNA (guanine(527)-N(7))-methyltransferase RsmG [Helicobacter saguini]MWV71187.1 16S rRNA (guanine(527)-N(7))-methyltransferase RsmG [Helicobacter saguini]
MKECKEIKIDIEIIKQDSKFSTLESYANLVLKWAKIHNITGAKNLDSIHKEIFDSLLPTAFLKPFENCIDIGSGAGFPGVILAIFYPDSFFYLLEPRAKRAAFLQHISLELKLENIEVIKDFSYNINNIKANLITSRAVCNTSLLIKDSLHLLQPNGCYLLFKGENSINEYKTLNNFDVEIFKHDKRFFIYAKREY